MGGGKDKVWSAPQAFREALVLELWKDLLPKAPKQVYVTKNTALPKMRLTRPIGIHQRIQGKRAACVFCRWSRTTKRGQTAKVITKTLNIKKTNQVLLDITFPFSHFSFHLLGHPDSAPGCRHRRPRIGGRASFGNWVYIS